MNVRLVGGPQDGAEYDVQDAGWRIYVAKPVPQYWEEPVGPLDPYAPDFVVGVYEHRGNGVYAWRGWEDDSG